MFHVEREGLLHREFLYSLHTIEVHVCDRIWQKSRICTFSKFYVHKLRKYSSHGLAFHIILLHPQGIQCHSHFWFGRGKHVSIVFENHCFMPHFGSSRIQVWWPLTHELLWTLSPSCPWVPNCYVLTCMYCHWLLKVSLYWTRGQITPKLSVFVQVPYNTSLCLNLSLVMP